MANPKHKISKMRTRKRRTHYKLTAAATTLCPECHEAKRPHYACLSCGKYNGREVVEAKA